MISLRKITSNKYELKLDNVKHIIYGDVLLKYNLLKPREITSKEMQNILNDNIFYENYNKMIKFCTFRKRCTKEVYNKLSILQVNNKDDIIKKLTENGYLNDDKFVNSYINDAIKTTLKGPKKILIELKDLGFSNVDLPEMDNENRCQKYILKKQKVNKSSGLMFKNKVSKELINLGYEEFHFRDFLNNLQIEDSKYKEKEYQKLLKKYSGKYEDYILEQKIKQALYKKGY